MAEQPLLYHQVDGIAILTLNNPERRNALSSPLLAALRDRLDETGKIRRYGLSFYAPPGPSLAPATT